MVKSKLCDNGPLKLILVTAVQYWQHRASSGNSVLRIHYIGYVILC
jgi:hypothetical protein